MGTSTDAILFFGYVWDDDEVEIPEEVAETYCYGNVEKYPVQVGHHCSGDYPMPYIFIAKTQIEAYRGSPKQVPMLTLANKTVAEEKRWVKMLSDFCDEHDIEHPDNAGWHLVSYWG